MAFVACLAVGTAALLHIRLEHMTRTLLQFLTQASLLVAEHRPVVIVELLDDLERPASVKDIAPDDFGLESVCHRVVPGFAQLVARLPKQEIAMAHQLMERVQVAACSLDAFQSLGHGADGLDCRIIEASGSSGLVGLGHPGTDTRSVERNTSL
jgi:hypothetical protein